MIIAIVSFALGERNGPDGLQNFLHSFFDMIFFQIPHLKIFHLVQALKVCFLHISTAVHHLTLLCGLSALLVTALVPVFVNLWFSGACLEQKAACKNAHKVASNKCAEVKPSQD